MKYKLKICARCKWIFEKYEQCPICGFAYYGARFIYGKKCYQYKFTQEPWFRKKITDYKKRLLDKIYKYNNK